MIDIIDDPNSIEIEDMTPLKEKQHLRTLMFQLEYHDQTNNKISVSDIICDGVELLLTLVEENGIDWYVDIHQTTSNFLDSE